MFVEAWPRGIKISGQAALFISLSKDDLLCTAVTAVSWGMCVHLGVPSQSPTLVIPALGRLRQRDCLKHQVNQDCITRFCQKKKGCHSWHGGTHLQSSTRDWMASGSESEACLVCTVSPRPAKYPVLKVSHVTWYPVRQDKGERW